MAEIGDNTPTKIIIDGTTTIELGEVLETTDSNALFSSSVNEDDSVSIFTDYIIRNRFESDKHIYMMPISSPNGFQGASVAFAQLASPTLLWICDWTACRFNKQPIAPSKTPADSNWIFMDEHLEPAMITVGPDGITPLYRISGTYFYGHKNPNSETIKNIYFPRPPWLDDGFDRTMPAEKMQTNLMDSNASTTTSTGTGTYTFPGQP